ncbi:alpha-glucan family phosphorylase [Ramlibacter sp.]|uniref:alpha-glucan family phosphorylase n=1 Tax=Ramlibacter sp. TaxID=1917967 RepID=UPI002FC79F44
MKDLHAKIAYFSMEIALEDAIPTYSGGLGVLAGDLLRSAADLGVPLIGVTLASRLGYFRQRLVDGAQREEPDPWDPAARAQRVPCTVAVRIDDRPVWVGAWRYALHGIGGQPDLPVILLDTDLPENAPADRRLTDSLYGGDDAYRLRQEMVLGIGGVRMLEALGLRVEKYHLNEGHSALLTLELLRSSRAAAAHGANLQDAVEAVRRRCVFTTHTPVEAGHDKYPYPLAEAALSGLVSPDVLRTLGGPDHLNLTRLALALSGWVNGVAERHAQTSRSLFPGQEVHAVSNGVHACTWTAEPFRRLFDRGMPKWRHEPELLTRALNIPDADIEAAHADCRRALFDHVKALPGGAALDPRRPTLGFARRMTGYKRPGLLFSSIPRLRAIAREFPFQVVVSGKAHPHDEAGKQAIRQLQAWAAELADSVPVVFVPDYRLQAARLLVAGTDVWLNTPEPPLEASGTSGMKAALNGVPSFSVLDGWWLEGCEEGVTGWAIGSRDEADARGHAESLYRKLEQTVLPAWYGPRPQWCAVMKAAIAYNGSCFNSHRMLRRYASEAYWS